jgi:hypothetical protein
VGWIAVLCEDLRRGDTREPLTTIDSDLQMRGVKMSGGVKMREGGKKIEEERRNGGGMRSGAEKQIRGAARRIATAVKIDG